MAEDDSVSMSTTPILRHCVLGPRSDGYWLVVYACDHTRELTVVCDMSDRDAAEREAARLNEEQIGNEMALQEERRLREMWRIR
jgi:hypothetical protein